MTRIIETSYGEVKLETTNEKGYLDCYIGDNYDDYVGIFGEDLYDTKNVIFTRYKKSPKVFKKIFSARKKITLANLSDMTPEDLLNNFPYTKENREYLDKIFNDTEKYDDEDYFDECYKLAEQQLKGEK